MLVSYKFRYERTPDKLIYCQIADTVYEKSAVSAHCANHSVQNAAYIMPRGKLKLLLLSICLSTNLPHLTGHTGGRLVTCTSGPSEHLESGEWGAKWSAAGEVVVSRVPLRTTHTDRETLQTTCCTLHTHRKTICCWFVRKQGRSNHLHRTATYSLIYTAACWVRRLVGQLMSVGAAKEEKCNNITRNLDVSD